MVWTGVEYSCMVRCSRVRYGAGWSGVMQYGAEWYGMAWCGLFVYVEVQQGTVWCAIVGHDTICGRMVRYSAA